MCIVCRDWQLGRLTSKEALRNLGEMIFASEDKEEQAHLWEISEKILDNEVPISDTDEELDKNWSDENQEG
jgi:hypothetical protein